MKALLLYIFYLLKVAIGVALSVAPMTSLEERVICMVEEKNIYAVQRTAKDSEYRLGLYHVFENAKKQADDTKYNVYNTETGKLVYKPPATRSELFVRDLYYEDRVVRDEIYNKKLPWVYSNGSIKFGRTFNATRKAGLRATNCVSGAQWAMLLSGCVAPNRDGVQWYGLNGDFRWLSANAESCARKYFNIIDVQMTTKKALKKGLLEPGDVCTYAGMAHTNVYLGDGKFFDSGHLNCTRSSGEKAPFKCWISDKYYPNAKIGKILRPIDGYFRVQCGVFSNKIYALARKRLVAKAGFDVKLVRDGRDYVVQCGLFSEEQNAVNLAKKIEEAGIPVLVKEV